MNAIFMHGLGTLLALLASLAPAAQDSAATTAPPEGPDFLAEEVYLPLALPESVKAQSGTVQQLLQYYDANLHVEGPSTAMLDQLESLRRRAATTRPYHQQEEHLRRIAILRARVFEALGRPEEARLALWHLVPNGHDRRWAADDELVPASPELLAVLQRVHEHPFLLEARRKLEQRLREGTTRGEEEETLRAKVFGLVQGGDRSTLLEIGPRAVPHLVEAILVAPDAYSGSHANHPKSGDPIRSLLRISHAQAAAALLENIDAGGYIWKRRILQAMHDDNVLRDRDAWTSTNDELSDPICLVPEWLEILEVLLKTPGLERDALTQVEFAVQHDALTPGLVEALTAIVDSEQRELAWAVVKLFEGKLVSDKEKPFLEHCVGVEDPLLRKFGVRRLWDCSPSSVLRECYDDPDAEIRQMVAHSLVPNRFVYRILAEVDGSPDGQHIAVQRTLDDRDLEILTTLLEDADPDVRIAALCSAVLQHPALGDEPFLAKLEDPDASVRQALARSLESFPARLASMLSWRLSADPSRQVVETIAARLPNLVNQRGPAPFVHTLINLLDPPHQPIEQHRRHDCLRDFAFSEASLPFLLGAALARPEDSLLNEILEVFHGTLKFKMLRQVEEPVLADLLVRMHRSKHEDLGRLLNEIRMSDPPRLGSLRIVFANPEAPVPFRLATAGSAAQRGGDEFSAALRRLLEDPWWKENRISTDDLQMIGSLRETLPPRERHEFQFEVANNLSLPDELSLALVTKYDPGLPHGAEITHQILERWFAPGVPEREAVHYALEYLGRFPDDKSVETLIAAARTPEYCETAILAMKKLRDPRFLPVLGECLEAPWMPDEGQSRTWVRAYAADALTGYFSDEAAALLLEGLRTTDKEVWDACTNGIQKIQDYRQRVADFGDVERTRPSAEDAAVALAAMLEDSDSRVRVEAIRGLATLGAVEYLPALIEQMQHPNAEVKAAARAALDRLNAAETPGSKEDD